MRGKTRLWLLSGLAVFLLGSAAPPIGPAEPMPHMLIGDNLVAAPAAAHPHDLLQVTTAVTHDSLAAPAPPPPNRGIRLVVSIPAQTLYVFEDGQFLRTSPVSTGRRGYDTPVGTFQILQKKRHHRSSLYDDAPMPFMQRLTWTGVALHAGRIPGYPASHGCIRLPWSVAQDLFGLTDYDTWVTVIRDAPDSPEAALALAAPFDWNASADG